MRTSREPSDHADPSATGGAGTPGKAPLTARIQRKASGGAPLPDDARARFEGSLGADLGAVRVHTGAASAAAADELGAHAFTVGDDIHFGASAYRPDDPFGMHLLAHEVAHTQQQAGAAPVAQARLEVSQPGDPAEHEADRAADAMVRGEPAWVSLIGGGAQRLVVQRQEADKPLPIGEAKVPSHAMSAEEQKDLDWSSTVVGKASADFDFALAAMRSYATQAPPVLDAIKETFQVTAKHGQAAFEQVNHVIEKAKDLAKLQSEVVSTFVSGVFGQFSEKIFDLCSQQAATVFGTSVDTVKTLSGLVSTVHGHAEPIAVKAKEAHDGPEGGGASGVDPALEQLAFWKSFAELHGVSTKLLPVVVELAGMGQPIGELKQAVKTAKASGKTDGDYPLPRMKANALALQRAAARLGDAAEVVPSILAGLRKSDAQTKATAPKTKLEAEKELWIKWAAGLEGKEKGTLDLDYLEEYLQKLGIWSQLGIDRGGWFSDDEQRVAICMASAQAKVLAHKGEVVSPTNKVVTLPFGGTTVLMVKLGDLPELPVAISEGPAVPVQAIVVGARATMTVDTDLLKNLQGKEAITERILRQKLVTVVMKGVADGSPLAESDDEG